MTKKTCNYKLCKGKSKINITTNADNLTIKWDLPKVVVGGTNGGI
jgi:hypothetical protein